MSTKTFTFAGEGDTEITLQIDTAIMTPEYARECVKFWHGHHALLSECEGDETQRYYEAVARTAASQLIPRLIGNYSIEGALEDMAKDEGWPPELGIQITDYQVPEFEASSFTLESSEG